MKHLKIVIALFISTAIIFSSCKPKEDKTTPPDKPVVTSGEKALVEVLSTNEIQSLTDMVNLNQRAFAKGKPVKISPIIKVSAATMTLSDNGSGNFSIDFGGSPNVLTNFFRGGDSLSVSGNVYPTASLQYAPSFLTWTATFVKTYYQSLVVTGSMTPDVNGVIGTDWVFTYTNVVQ